MMKQLFTVLVILTIAHFCNAQIHYYVATTGNDRNPGTFTKPFKTPEFAIGKALSHEAKNVIIELRRGTYNLHNTIGISSAVYRLRSLIIRGYSKEKVIINGARKFSPSWKPYKKGIMQASIDFPEAPDRLFLNGKSLHMARYPNYDPSARVFNGTAADAISEERVKNWNDPTNGYIHALHNGEWGDFHYHITGKDAEGKLQYEGGWQNNRPAPMHRQHRFVENIFEELDAPGEWFYDTKKKILFLYPPKLVNLEAAKFETSWLTDLVRISGTADNPVRNITISKIEFRQSNRSFMLTKEPLLRSDWTIYRGGAILLEGTENITVSDCIFTELGGHALFMSNYNKNNLVKDNYIHNIGGNAIAFVGNANAVRSPAFRYEWFVPWNEMDYTPGSKTNEYPQYCTAEGNLVHTIGTIEKQVAGVQIEMAAHITVRHNSIYKVPRSGINIGDGCWGGHVLENNDVFNAVLETGDHGAFNSWGRDRFWRPERTIIDSIVAAKPGIELLDVIDPIIMRNNRFQCDHGWDIDLDDGSSNYQIYNNVCLSGGIKLREGYHRTVFNNILVNNTFHPHVWLSNSGDVFKYNIITTPYAPIQINTWGKMVDSNFFLLKDGLIKAQRYKIDSNSIYGDAMFINASKGDYRLKPGSPALKAGFKNFPMEFGVTHPSLKAIAEKPVFKPLLTKLGETKGELIDWLGGKFKNIETLGERSASGLHNDNGALLVEFHPSSIIAKNNLQKGDVIIKMGNEDINTIGDLLKVYQSTKWMGRANCIVLRNQSEQKIDISFNKE